jgi:uncharacterized protein YkwD
MLRAALLAFLALAAAGCGSGSTSTPAAPEQPRAAVAPVESTAGRLGDATEVRQGRAPHGLSAGGEIELAETEDAPRRDGVGAGAACANADAVPAAGLDVVAEATLCLLNGERADHGLAPLASNAKLATAASAFAQDLVAGSYFSHTGRDGSDILDRIERTGYIRDDRPWRVGENLAWGTGVLATPGAIVQAWMGSPGHRDNILNPAYREIGIGVAAGNPSRADGAGATYATEFGVIEDADAAVAAKKPKAKKARRGSRRGGARKARVARRGGQGRSRGGKGGKRRVKGRGPVARIAV